MYKIKDMKDVYKITPDSSGWRPLPNGYCIQIGHNVTGTNIQVGNNVIIEDHTALGDNTTIDAYTSIGKRVAIGNNVKISKDVAIGDGVTIDNNVTVDDLAVIENGTRIGMNSKIGSSSVLENNILVHNDTTIGRYCKLYSNCEIGKNVVLDDCVKISNGVLIPSNTKIHVSPLTIAASYHPVTILPKGFVQIGCVTHKLAYWKEHYKTIGKRYGYSKERITEYGKILNFLEKMVE